MNIYMNRGDKQGRVTCDLLGSLIVYFSFIFYEKNYIKIKESSVIEPPFGERVGFLIF